MTEQYFFYEWYKNYRVSYYKFLIFLHTYDIKIRDFKIKTINDNFIGPFEMLTGIIEMFFWENNYFIVSRKKKTVYYSYISGRAEKHKDENLYNSKKAAYLQAAGLLEKELV